MVNSNELKQKHHNNNNNKTASNNTITIEEGDDIATVTFFIEKPHKGIGWHFVATKPSKKVKEAIVFLFFATMEP
jgi:hypothetical protein